MIIHPNILLIAGSGRNVGKTSLACAIIDQFKDSGISAIKISPHLHHLENEDNLLVKNKYFQIINETSLEGLKDSSKMLKAGAEKVIYVQSEDDHIEEAFDAANDFIDMHGLIIVESGGLRKVLKPGVFLFLTKRGMNIKNKHLHQYADLVMDNGLTDIDGIIERVGVAGDKWVLEQ